MYRLSGGCVFSNFMTCVHMNEVGHCVLNGVASILLAIAVELLSQVSKFSV